MISLCEGRQMPGVCGLSEFEDGCLFTYESVNNDCSALQKPEVFVSFTTRGEDITRETRTREFEDAVSMKTKHYTFGHPTGKERHRYIK